MFYDWLLNVLRQEYDLVHIIKESSRSSIRLLRHRKTGKNSSSEDCTDPRMSIVSC